MSVQQNVRLYREDRDRLPVFVPDDEGMMLGPMWFVGIVEMDNDEIYAILAGFLDEEVELFPKDVNDVEDYLYPNPKTVDEPPTSVDQIFQKRPEEVSEKDDDLQNRFRDRLRIPVWASLTGKFSFEHAPKGVWE